MQGPQAIAPGNKDRQRESHVRRQNRRVSGTMSKKDAPISAENKTIARHVAKAFGGSPRVHEYADRPERLTVGILYSRDRPRAGVTSYSTIRLSDHPMPWGDGEFPTRLELAGACVSEAELF